MKKSLEQCILSGNFAKAKEIYLNMEFEKFYDALLEIAYDNESIANYSFVVHLLLEEEDERLHDLGYILMSQSLCHIEGAYISALYHAKKAVELTLYKDVGYMENLLFLNIVPDKVFSDEEAKKIAKKILTIDPKNEAAKKGDE